MVNTRKYSRLLGLTLTMCFTRLNAQEQRELQGRMEKKQMKEFMTVGLILGTCSVSFLLGLAHHLPIDVLKAGPEVFR